MKINFVLPFFLPSPGGGIKVMYEYARRLSLKGHDVVVYHCLQTPYTIRHQRSRFVILWKYFQRRLKKQTSQRPDWFDLPSKVACKTIPFVANLCIRNADITVSTWWATAYESCRLNRNKGFKCNLIQDYEVNMTDQKELVIASYNLPMRHIVISHYLNDVVLKHSGRKPTLIPNGLDAERYKINDPPDKRHPHSILMLFSNHPRKGSQYGIAALEILRRKYPDMRAMVFSTEKKPVDFPEWIDYNLNPGNLVALYNQSSVFVSPSIQEGWGLPPMEAMACGCACVCTNIPAHVEYMEHNGNALLVRPGSVDEIEQSVSNLFENKELRFSLVRNAQNKIRAYSWDQSVELLERTFLEAINGKEQES